MDKKCAFFGHRDIIVSEELRKKLKTTITDLIKNHEVTVFYFGGLGDFDSLCYAVVTELMQEFPTIKRVYCVYDKRDLIETKRPKYLRSLSFEEFISLDCFDYWYTRIYFRNCKIIDECDYITFYVRNTENSGAYKALQYANKKNKKTILL